MEAIGTYYNNNSELTVSHMIVMWLVHDPEGPMEKLSEVLNATGEHEIAVQLTHLSSLGKEAVCNRVYCECESLSKLVVCMIRFVDVVNQVYNPCIAVVEST